MTAAPASPERTLTSAFVTAVYFGFLLTGTATVILGPLLPRLHAQSGVAHSTLAWLSLVQFTSHSLGAIVSGGNVRRSLSAGYPLAALGLMGLAAGWPWALGAIAVMGFGLGLAIPATNIFIAQQYPRRRAAALSHLNMMWVAGAGVSPLLFAGLETVGAARLAPLLLALPFLGIAAVLPQHVAAVGAGRPAGGQGAVSVSVLAFFALEMFLYAGTEASVGTWIISVAKQYLPGDSSIPEMIGASFFIALLAGRAVWPVLMGRLGTPAVHRLALALASAAALLLLSARSVPMLWAGATLAGLAFAPIFPILAARLVEYTYGRNPAAAGPVFAVAGFGAGALPWLAGRVVAVAGPIDAALLVPAAGVAALVLTAVVGPPGEKA